ncbi:DEAD/DEAH box RNA helicase [Blastocystis sp. ATCC 50177/Nand II]|uniref:RNA helicase n=1 Tax=Blastocystis sp. subtype 1 (strain ATCC 50177 / NandII) TaxID=478820 RepID=A0A196SE81_BLAHN|nr:DEAD/DEAH box RNA helicase [Blastocystis sp. ATCC 50177/Nand II]
MSEAAFSLLSLGLSFKGVKKSEKELFKKGKHSKMAPKIQKTTIDIPTSIDVFHYENGEEAKAETKSRKRERQERRASVDNDAAEKGVKSSEVHFKSEDQINEFRNRLHISVMGGDIPNPITSFDQMAFTPEQAELKQTVLRNIEGFEYKEPTPIQMQSIPIVIANRDILGIAPTGSGKTAAYLLPLIQRLGTHQPDRIRSIVLTPTAELAHQVSRHFARLSEGSGLKSLVLSKPTLTGVIDKGVKVDCLVATPLRLISTIASKTIDFAGVEVLVLDEGDKLFEDSFVEQIDAILAACTNPRLQRLLFSATLPSGVEDLARTVLRDPIRVVIGTRNASNTNVEQKLLYCGNEDGKLLALRNILREVVFSWCSHVQGFQPPMLIFVQSKERARQLYTELAYDNVSIDVIHSDLSPAARAAAINKFRIGETWVLIATDLLGRGLDFLGLNTVVNYDFPQSGVEYIHRVGRTGRAGRKGTAITLFTEDDKPMLRSIANLMKLSGCEVPEWMLQLKKIDKRDRKRIEKHAIKREDITTQASFDKKRKKAKKNHKNHKKNNKKDGEEDASLLA